MDILKIIFLKLRVRRISRRIDREYDAHDCGAGTTDIQTMGRIVTLLEDFDEATNELRKLELTHSPPDDRSVQQPLGSSRRERIPRLLRGARNITMVTK